MKFLSYFNFFKKSTAEDEAKRLEFEYARNALAHQEAAEHHAALATFYKTGLVRMGVQLSGR